MAPFKTDSFAWVALSLKGKSTVSLLFLSSASEDSQDAVRGRWWTGALLPPSVGMRDWRGKEAGTANGRGWIFRRSQSVVHRWKICLPALGLMRHGGGGDVRAECWVTWLFLNRSVARPWFKKADHTHPQTENEAGTWPPIPSPGQSWCDQHFPPLTTELFSLLLVNSPSHLNPVGFPLGVLPWWISGKTEEKEAEKHSSVIFSGFLSPLQRECRALKPWLLRERKWSWVHALKSPGEASYHGDTSGFSPGRAGKDPASQLETNTQEK